MAAVTAVAGAARRNTWEILRAAARHVGGTHAVWLALLSHANAEGLAWPSRDTIAMETGITSHRRIDECLDRLHRSGWIQPAQRPGGGRGKTWRILPPDRPLISRDSARHEGDPARVLADILSASTMGAPTTRMTG